LTHCLTLISYTQHANISYDALQLICGINILTLKRYCLAMQYLFWER